MPIRPPPPPLRLSSRPLLAAAGALGAGIVTEHAAGLGPGPWLALGCLAALGAAGYGLTTRRRLVTLRRLTTVAAGLAVLVAAGGVRQAAWASLPPDHVGHLATDDPDATPVELWGALAKAPADRARTVAVLVAVDSVRLGDRTQPARGDVLVSLARPFDGEPMAFPTLHLGDRVRVEAQLELPPRRRNPADFDYGAYLQRQGTHATAYVRDPEAVVFLGPPTRPAHQLAAAVQAHVRAALARHVPSAEARGVLLALLLGDRSSVGTDALDAFRETGLMHLLAVSGLHVLLVGMSLFVFLKPVLGRLGWGRRTVDVMRGAITLALLGVYVLVTGASVSVVRAFVMASLAILGVILQRRVDALNTLGLAALVLLVLRPTALFDVGFQLSFSAVAALVTLVPLFEGRLPAWSRHGMAGTVTSSVTASLAATLGTAPVLLVHFGRVALGGLVLNLPAIPLTAATLGAGLGTVVLDKVPVVGRSFGALASVSGDGLLLTSRLGAEWLGTWAVDAFLDRPLVVAALAAGLVALALARRPVARLRVATVGVACLALGAWTSIEAPALDVVFLDVGQGDATLLTTPGRRAVLVDAGVKTPYSDQGERTVVPHLVRAGVERLDALVLTHADADHIGGAAAVLRALPVGRVVTNGHGGETRLWAELRATADSLGVPVVAARAGDTLAVDPAVRIRILGPTRRHTDANEASLVVRVRHGATRWLLTGDAETQGEADLVRTVGEHLAADVVKVGHHGSRTSSTSAFVAAAGRPAFAVVSVGARNRYGLPDEEPLGRWLSTGADVLQTATEGAVWLRSDGETVERIEWRDD